MHPSGQHGRIGLTSRGHHATTRTATDPVVSDLVTRARNGDKKAWDALVERYAPQVWQICRRHRLDDADADHAGQAVWLRLVDQLPAIRDPAALPGWLATVTRRECLRILRATSGPQTAGYELDAEGIPAEQASTGEHELLTAERHAALCEAFADLPSDSQQLIALLIADPPLSNAEISARLNIPIGSIGPIHKRCLDKLRRHPAIAALLDADSSAAAKCNPPPAVDWRGAATGSGSSRALQNLPSDELCRCREADPFPQT
jgi:RNA polymerase sigma factor (sigma-70 family)